MIKRFFIFSFFFLAALPDLLCANDVTISVRPEQPVAGMTANLSLTSTKGNIATPVFPTVKESSGIIIFPV